jgi:2-polyprenyl-3-methyl-5-hydroxy-6-metoxy-1,4-benzoquinol methylase
VPTLRPWPQDKEVEARLEAVGDRVRQFYNQVPFPGNLDAYGPWQDQAPSLLQRLGLPAETVKGTTLLDAGCGTGEYSRSFANLGANVTAIDLSEGALQRAQEIDAALGLTGIAYRRCSLFDLPDQEYDVVASLGVLHHTGEPERGFYSVASRVRPGGILIVGLYNPVSRLHILAVRHLIRLLSLGSTERGIRIAGSQLLRPLVRRSIGAANAQQPQRLADLLVHPHEAPVPIGRTLGWFQRAGFSVFGSDPSLNPKDYAWIASRLPRKVRNLAIELRWLIWNADYYVVAGRKRA